jgi:hypothetical protein
MRESIDVKIKSLPKPIQKWLYDYVIFRPGIVYAFSCLDHFTAVRVEWAYVGQTRQELASRYNQHMGLDYRQPAQPWSDLYPEIRVVWQGKCPNKLLNLIEKYYIKRHKVLYNYIHNTNNPRRVTKYQAKAQRKERDLRRSYGSGTV